MGKDIWPVEMDIIKINLLRTTLLDEQIKSISGNDLTVLPSLRQAFMSVILALATKRDEELRELLEKDSPSDEDQDEDSDSEKDDDGDDELPGDSDNEKNNPDNTPVDSEDGSTDDEESVPKPPESTEEQQKQEDQAKLSLLQSRGFECVNDDWMEFVNSKWSTKKEKVDSIITEPPPSTTRSYPALTKSRTKSTVEIDLDDVTKYLDLSKEC